MPSFRTSRSSAKTRPVLARCSSAGPRRGSVRSNTMSLPPLQSSSSVRPRIRQAAELAENTCPQGAVDRMPSRLVSNSRRYRSSLSLRVRVSCCRSPVRCRPRSSRAVRWRSSRSCSLIERHFDARRSAAATPIETMVRRSATTSAVEVSRDDLSGANLTEASQPARRRAAACPGGNQ